MVREMTEELRLDVMSIILAQLVLVEETTQLKDH